MADTLDRIDIQEGDSPGSALPKPKLRLSFLRQVWQDWSNSLPCVQQFNAEQAAARGAAEETLSKPPACSDSS